MNYILTILIILMALTNALMDRSSENKLKGWWNKDQWRNKWKNGNKKEGEKFWGSSRWFVFLTDGWHLLQFFFHSLWQLAIALSISEGWWILLYFVGIKIVFSVTFELIYRRI